MTRAARRKAAFSTALLAATVLMTVAAAGCKGGDDDDTAPNFVPKVVAFEGKTDPKFAGDWTSKDGSSTIGLATDGSLKLGVKSSSQNGTSTSHYDGQWLVSGSDLRLKYKDSSSQETVLSYKAELSGNSLVLQQSGGKMKTNYTRK